MEKKNNTLSIKPTVYFKQTQSCIHCSQIEKRALRLRSDQNRVVHTTMSLMIDDWQRCDLFDPLKSTPLYDTGSLDMSVHNQSKAWISASQHCFGIFIKQLSLLKEYTCSFLQEHAVFPIRGTSITCQMENLILCMSLNNIICKLPLSPLFFLPSFLLSIPLSYHLLWNFLLH